MKIIVSNTDRENYPHVLCAIAQSDTGVEASIDLIVREGKLYVEVYRHLGSDIKIETRTFNG